MSGSLWTLQSNLQVLRNLRRVFYCQINNSLSQLNDGMKKFIKELVKMEVSKDYSKSEKFINRSTRVCGFCAIHQRKGQHISCCSCKLCQGNHIDCSYKVVGEAYEADKILVRYTWAIQGERYALYRCLFMDQQTRSSKRCPSIEQAEEEVQHPSDWFQKPTRLPSPDHAWNTSVPAVHESVQPWLSNLAQQDPRESFDELTDSTFDFSAFRSKPAKEVYKATTEKLDWINPEGRQYPHDLRQPLPLIPNSQGRRVIPFNHFINNDLEYLRGGVSSRKYSTSVTKTQAADYGHIKWIEDLVPNSMWSQTIVKYGQNSPSGESRIGARSEDTFDGLQYEKGDDDVLYKFKEGDFHRLRIQDIEDMLLLLVQGKVTNLSVEERIAFNVSLRMFTRSVVIHDVFCGMEDLHLGLLKVIRRNYLTKPRHVQIQSKKTQTLILFTPNQRIHLQRNKERRTDDAHRRTTQVQRYIQESFDYPFDLCPEYQSEFIHNEDGNPA
ncbi:hypothetical protein Tco_0221892 [Tanacetum coccineum]